MLKIEQDINNYLEETDIIDFSNPQILNRAKKLQLKSSNPTDLINRTFEFVKEDISYSSYVNNKIVTCKASEVLLENVGICHSKSHLLAALLRANKIPCGFCYQRVMFNDNNESTWYYMV